MNKIKLPVTDKSVDNPRRDFIELKANRILCNNIILPGKRNLTRTPMFHHHTRLWVIVAAFSNQPTYLGAVWADNKQEALDTLIDARLGRAIQIDDETLESMDEKEQDSLAYLGDERQACDLTNVSLIPVRFSVTRDRKLLTMFKEARKRKLPDLGKF